MTESLDDGARRVWQGERSSIGPTGVAQMVERRVRARRGQTRRFIASATIIVPGWIAVFAMLPDLRPVAVVGLAVGAVLGWLHLSRYRRGLSAAQSAAACADYQAGVLRQEQQFHRSLSTWGMLVMVIGQVVIIATLWSNSRFEKNGFFAGSLTAFIITAIAALGFVFQRSRKMLGEVEHELSILMKGVEA